MLSDSFIRFTAIVVILSVLCLSAGCGGGGGGSSRHAETNSNTDADTSTESTGSITGLEWFFINAEPDYFGPTCLLSVTLHYSASITSDQIESFTFTAPTGDEWTIPSYEYVLFGSDNNENNFAMMYLAFSNPDAFPLAGIWTVKINLKDGSALSFQESFHEPGSCADATHKYLYTKEDWAPVEDVSQYIPALGRFPSQGYAVHYSSESSGNISTQGFSGVLEGYQNAEPRAFNMYCDLFDADLNYIGITVMRYSILDHSSTNLITSEGELSIVPESTLSFTGAGYVDLSTVKYIRIVNTDGAQYTPSSYATFDYCSISSLIEVN